MSDYKYKNLMGYIKDDFLFLFDIDLKGVPEMERSDLLQNAVVVCHIKKNRIGVDRLADTIMEGTGVWLLGGDYE